VVRKNEILGSFSAGFGNRGSTDLINGLFVAFRKLRVKPPFEFVSRGSMGVESKEIREIFLFNGIPKTRKNHKDFFCVGQALSKLNSDEIGWVAQYLADGKNHLFPKEAKRAIQLEKSLNLSCP